MFPKLSLSIAAAIALSTLSGTARAAPVATNSPATSAQAPTSTQIDRGEAGDPDSLGYSARMLRAHPSTDDEINAAEVGSPDSVDNRNLGYPAEGDSTADWQRLESADPDQV